MVDLQCMWIFEIPSCPLTKGYCFKKYFRKRLFYSSVIYFNPYFWSFTLNLTNISNDLNQTIYLSLLKNNRFKIKFVNQVWSRSYTLGQINNCRHIILKKNFLFWILNNIFLAKGFFLSPSSESARLKIHKYKTKHLNGLCF